MKTENALGLVCLVVLFGGIAYLHANTSEEEEGVQKGGDGSSDSEDDREYAEGYSPEERPELYITKTPKGYANMLYMRIDRPELLQDGIDSTYFDWNRENIRNFWDENTELYGDMTLDEFLTTQFDGEQLNDNLVLFGYTPQGEAGER
jgi:hypothetical protein|tara:strand:- start:18121 stop:18564 length:444 start_codon:yes stop_codon:yes gene_type:complete